MLLEEEGECCCGWQPVRDGRQEPCVGIAQSLHLTQSGGQCKGKDTTQLFIQRENQSYCQTAFFILKKIVVNIHNIKFITLTIFK